MFFLQLSEPLLLLCKRMLLKWLLLLPLLTLLREEMVAGSGNTAVRGTTSEADPCAEVVTFGLADSVVLLLHVSFFDGLSAIGLGPLETCVCGCRHENVRADRVCDRH